MCLGAEGIFSPSYPAELGSCDRADLQGNYRVTTARKAGVTSMQPFALFLPRAPFWRPCSFCSKKTTDPLFVVEAFQVRVNPWLSQCLNSAAP